MLRREDRVVLRRRAGVVQSRLRGGAGVRRVHGGGWLPGAAVHERLARLAIPSYYM